MSDDDPRAALATLTARVAALEAERAAGNLAHRYAAALDRPDPEVLARLFVADGVLDTSRGTYRGRDEIAAFFRRAAALDDSEKRHFVCAPEVRASSAEIAELDCYFGFTGRGENRSMLGWGTYSAACRVESGTASFERLTIRVHVGTDLEAGWPRDVSAPIRTGG
ncbi:nuclear transport factor 2 family protein [Rhodococcus sp. NPDC003318]|uniref:nuclear transport factor 2 family protein n=1 Tax=Rhodococcus sp. NPDC003318 TaxID=3364503 RepID=UPI0036B4B290